MDYHKLVIEMEDIIHRINYLYVELAKYLGITYTELLVYIELYRFAPCTQACIVNQCGISKQTVSKIVKRLDELQYIELNEGVNKKEKKISFTTLGEEKIGHLVNNIFDIETNALKELDDAEIKYLLSGMINFSNAFEKHLNGLVENE